MNLLQQIERNCRDRGISVTRFGRECLNDPCFVAQLRRGREPRDATRAKVFAYLKKEAVNAGPQ